MTVAEISMDMVRELADLRDALKACVMFSHKPMKEVAYALEIETSHLSKMLNPSADPRHFPPQKIGALMDVCGNEIPLLWLIQSRGYPDPRETRLQAAVIEGLRRELKQAQGEGRLVMNVFKSFELKE